MLDVFRQADKVSLAAISAEMEIRKTDEIFLLFGLGSQFDHLIYQQVSKRGVFCLVADPATVTAEDVRALKPKGIILSGGPASVVTEPPPFDDAIFTLGIPVLGICLGFQKWAKHVGVDVKAGDQKEFGSHVMTITGHSPLLQGLKARTTVLQSHGDKISSGPPIEVHAFSDYTESGDGIVAVASYKHLHGVQFHPEVPETEDGDKIFANFCFGICCARNRFPAQNIAQQKIDKLKQTIGDRKVLLALSGGSDSAVTEGLLERGAGRPGQIRAIYIRGIDRPDDEAFVLKHYSNRPKLELKIVDATDRFLHELSRPPLWSIRGIIRRLLHGPAPTSMHAKRLVVRKVYKEILEEEARLFGASFIAQGTLYTDLSESGKGYNTGARRARIKLHHNTGLKFSLPELIPLADCVKDGARDIGRQIDVPEELLVRHPFPGPGLVVRIEGEVTEEKLAMARKLDGIYVEELRKAGLYHSVWQAGVVVTDSVHTVTKGDDAGNGIVVAIWAVWSVNGFTAQAAALPDAFLRRIARRVGNEVRGVGAVTYRISDKPFSTIEWG